jgi:hypothetical protein
VAKAAAEAEKKQRLQQEALKQKQESREIQSRMPSSSSSSSPPSTSQVRDIPNGNHIKATKVSPSTSSRKVATISAQWIEKIKQLSIDSTSIAYILFVLFIVGFLGSQRARLRAAFQLAASKLWATIQMGTKVTYV